MQKLLMISALAVISLSVPQIASAQNSPQGQQQQSIQARVKNNLEQAGFTNVQIMPSSFLVRAKDKEGNPVMMVIQRGFGDGDHRSLGRQSSGGDSPRNHGRSSNE